MKKCLCGACGKKMVRITIPAKEMGPYWSYNRAGVLKILGREKDVPRTVLEKIHKAGFDPVLVDPQQWGCMGCETVQTYWYRHDGAMGDLFRQMVQRKRGKGRPVTEEIPGDLKQMTG